MRTFLIALLAFSIVATGAAGLSWYVQANHTRENMERVVSAINESGEYLTYDRIETSGFPSRVIVSLVNPRFSGRIDQMPFLQEAQAKKELPPLPEWREDIKLNGTLAVSVNMLSNQYSLSLNGTWESTSNLGGRSFSMKSQQSTSSICTLNMDSATLLGHLWSFRPLESGENWKDSFRLLDCMFPPSTIVRTADNVPLATGEGGRFYISYLPQGARSQLRFFLNSKDSEITPAGDELVMAYLTVMAPDYPYGIPVSSYGKQNVDVDFSYDGPSDPHAADARNQPFDIYLSKLNVSNNVYTSESAFQLKQDVIGDSRTGRFLLKSKSTFSEFYDVVMQDMLRGMLKEVYDGSMPQYEPFRKDLPQGSTKEEMFAIMAPALPNFHSLGTLTLAVDTGFQWKPNFSAGEVNMAELELSSSLYGVTGSGTVKKAETQPFPAVNMTLNCRNCPRMVDDIFAYAARVHAVVKKLSPDTPPLPYHPSLPDGIKAFLQALSEPADAANFTYIITGNNGPMDLTISGRPLDEVMQLHARYVVPYLTPPAPPTTTGNVKKP